MIAHFRRYFIAGLLVWLPLWVTFLAIHFLITTMDRTLNLLPMVYRPDYWLGFHIPGLGLIFTILVLFFTGMAVTNFLGHKLVRFGDHLISKIPLVRSIYMGVKKTLETMLTSQTDAFRKVLLVQYPKANSWCLAFQTGATTRRISDTVQQELVTVFIPTTPNPTSGFMLVVSKQDVLELDMSIDDALKMIISLGVVQPTNSPKRVKPLLAE